MSTSDKVNFRAKKITRGQRENTFEKYLPGRF